ncbi:MAG TPA: energy transducer TonB [Oculatellaceae cyanobacterium]
MTKELTNKLLAVSFCLGYLICQTAGQARTLTIGTESSSSFNPPQPVFAPEPIIPEHLHEQCFKSCCIAKFFVKADGNTSVQLISTSGSDEVDELTLETLRRWRFKPATLDGSPVEGSKKVQVEFKVE